MQKKYDFFLKTIRFFLKTIKKTRAPVSTRAKRYNGVAYPLRRTGGRYVWVWSFSPEEKKEQAVFGTVFVSILLKRVNHTIL